MKKLMLLLLGVIIISCSGSNDTDIYEENNYPTGTLLNELINNGAWYVGNFKYPKTEEEREKEPTVGLSLFKYRSKDQISLSFSYINKDNNCLTIVNGFFITDILLNTKTDVTLSFDNYDEDGDFIATALYFYHKQSDGNILSQYEFKEIANYENGKYITDYRFGNYIFKSPFNLNNTPKICN